MKTWYFGPYFESLLSIVLFIVFLASMDCVTTSETTCNSNPLLKKTFVSQCIADCLDLSDDFGQPPCNFDEKYGHVLGIKCPRDFNQPVKSSKVLFCDFLMGLPKSLEMSLIFMCDIISFSQFFQYDSVLTKTFLLRDKNQETFVRMREAATKFGVKLIAKIGSFDDDVMSLDVLSLEISTPEKRADLEEQLLYFVDKYNLDGYLLYWVSPGCPWSRCVTKYANDKTRFVLFIRSLGEKLKAKGNILILKTLTTDIKVNLFLGDYFSNITKVVDYFIMDMSYQTNFTNSIITLGSSLQVSQDNLNELTKGVMNKSVVNKLLISYNPLTLNFKFALKSKNKLGSPHIFHREPYYTVSEICKSLRDKKYSKVLNVSTQNYAFSDSYLFAYDDKKSMQEKIKKLVIDMNLAGISVEIQHDDFLGECDCGPVPYTRMIANLLKRRHCSFESCF